MLSLSSQFPTFLNQITKAKRGDECCGSVPSFVPSVTRFLQIRLNCIVTRRSGRMRWKELPEIHIDDHIIILPEELDVENIHGETSETYINAYVAELASWPAMSRDKPLWEIHILSQRRRCIVLRLHHALGDCVSLLALFLASCDLGGDLSAVIPSIVGGKNKEGLLRSIARAPLGVCRLLKVAWRMLLISVFEAKYTLYRMEDKTSIAGGLRVHLMPRKLATLSLSMDDMIIVKNKLNAKINDVFSGIVLCGLAKYLLLKSPDEPFKEAVISVGNAFNVRGQGAKELMLSIKEGDDIEWGNMVAVLHIQMKLVSPTKDPLQYVRNVRDTLNKKKKSNEALTAFKCHRLMRPSGGKLLERLHNRMAAHTSVTLSNMMGPSNPIFLKGNPVIKIGVTITKQSTPLQVHMISYYQKAYLQFLAASEIIPDPDCLSSCVDEALRDMKLAAVNMTTSDREVNQAGPYAWLTKITYSMPSRGCPNIQPKTFDVQTFN
ncbi:wax ester synthase/diacylglycerol acyltransferase 3-like isoform X2 [Wolffia australiana]